jgi:hypothetical protein
MIYSTEIDEAREKLNSLPYTPPPIHLDLLTFLKIVKKKQIAVGLYYLYREKEERIKETTKFISQSCILFISLYRLELDQ